MRKSVLALLLAALLPQGASAQRITQQLGRGVTAVNRTQGDIRYNRGSFLVSWRRFAEEPEGTVYRVYINGSMVCQTSNTNYVPSALADGDVVTVNPVYGGTEDTARGGSYTYRRRLANVFMDIDFETTVCPSDDFRTPFVFPGDLDGDGETDWVVIRNTASSQYNTMAQAYRSDGTCMWTFDFGPNIDPFAGQNSLLTVYDIDCDGKAEVIAKTSDGSRFWNKAASTWGLYPKGSTTPDTDGDGVVDYTKVSHRNAPWYMTVIDGETGAEMTTCELDYASVYDGEDRYGRDNRADYMDDDNGREYAFMTGHIIVTYDDGMHPMVMAECLDRTKAGERHHNYVFGFGYDWVGGQPSNWHHSYTWSRNDKTPWPAEGHQLRAADVDGDGRDELLQLGFGVNTAKGMVFSAGIGHGDRYRTGDLDPTRPGMETYAIQQSDLLGQVVYDAATGRHLKEWHLPSVYDVGRGECMDVDSTRLGYEVYSLMPNLYDIRGEVVRSGQNPYPYEGIWWDGDLGREKLSSPGGNGFSSNAQVEKDYGSRLAEFSRESGWATHAGWAARAAFWGDITGDWREEVVLVKQSNEKGATGIVGYTTDIYTPHSLYTLLQDPHYLLDCTSRGYYQSPNTAFYLGYQMKRPPLPGTMRADLRWKGGAGWEAANAFTTNDGREARTFANGKSVMFDISGDTTQTVALNTVVEPAKTYFMVPLGHSYTIGGSGAIGGTGEVWKSERGTLTLNADITTTGPTIVSNGLLRVNGTISGPVSLRAHGSLGGTLTLGGDVEFEGTHNYEGCRLMPVGQMTFGKSLVVNRHVYDEVTLGDGTVDKIRVEGDLAVHAPLTFTVHATTTDNRLLAGDYTLVEVTGTIRLGHDSLLSVRLLDGQPYTLAVVGSRIVLSILPTRAASEAVAWKGMASGTWDYLAANFDNGGATASFVQNDKVVFGDEARLFNVNLAAKMIAGNLTFDHTTTYTLGGKGSISGHGGLEKRGPGELVMRLAANDYTGQTVVRGGTLTVGQLSDVGYASSIGSGAQPLVIAGGELKVDADNVATDRRIEIADTAIITVANAGSSMSLKAPVTGINGVLVKRGPGQLNFAYPGLYAVKALVMEDGTLAQGAAKATCGHVPVYARKGESHIDMIANGSYPAVVYDHPTDVSAEATLTLGGGEHSQQRGVVAGSYTGQGRLRILSGGVRFCTSGDFAAFGGTLHFEGSAGLRENVTDMKRLTLTLGEGASLYHVNSAFAAVAANLRVGALGNPEGLRTYATLPRFGGLTETWEVGHNGQNATYSGLLTAKTVTKVGRGSWTLTSVGSTSSIHVSGGQFFFRNASGAATTGTITAQDSGYVAGTGTTGSILVRNGGMVGVGTVREAVSLLALKTTSNIIVNGGGTLLVKANGTRNDKYQVGGTVFRLMAGSRIRVEALDGHAFRAGDELAILTTSSRLPVVAAGLVVESNDGSVWSTEKLATEGKLVCTAVTGIGGVAVDASVPVSVYTVDGRLVRSRVPQRRALDGLPGGIYVVNGTTVVR